MGINPFMCDVQKRLATPVSPPFMSYQAVLQGPYSIVLFWATFLGERKLWSEGSSPGSSEKKCGTSGRLTRVVPAHLITYATRNFTSRVKSWRFFIVGNSPDGRSDPEDTLCSRNICQIMSVQVVHYHHMIFFSVNGKGDTGC